MITLAELSDSSSTFIGSETVAILQCVLRDASFQGESGDQDAQNDPRPGRQESCPQEGQGCGGGTAFYEDEGGRH